nr:peptidase [Ktedonobacterales bacterium]
PRRLSSNAQRARAWVISSYPLLGALATAFQLVEDAKICQAMDIKVAAVDESLREIYLNPTIAMSEMECRFVLAHEMLHAGLRHGERRQGRDPFLWNVACDYVINQWLIEMDVGVLPRFGALYDVELKGLSAEAVYDRIVGDLRTLRKLTTFRGQGMGDIIDGRTPEWWANGDGVALDEFYRRALGQGLTYHQANGRGLVPAGLVEEIAALAQPPIPWDVELARWFDHYFPPLEKTRTYFRPSRRQGATPDIPRPRYVAAEQRVEARTFGVVLDTSGSMERAVLARALGAIASYALAREVPAARVIFCDAAAYDAGYLPPEAIAERVRVRGRGGTVLQPGIDLLQNAEDFPATAPILIITDGLCDRVHLRREHAFLLPPGASLPFGPVGPVFRMGVGD